jgi:hypothetical protein
MADRDLLRALQLYEQVEAKGLINPPALVGKTTVLLAMGRVDEAIAVARRIYQADPQNFDGAVAPVETLWLSRRTGELFDVINNGPSRFTPLPRMAAFYFTGAVMDTRATSHHLAVRCLPVTQAQVSSWALTFRA